MSDSAGHFSDPDAVARYAEGAHRKVPGLTDAHRMTSLLLAERVPDDGRVLVIGAGGGLELRHLAGDHASWRFDGVDPSAEMLALAAANLTPDQAARTTLHEGVVDAAPAGPFDGATCLLVLHFLPAEERLRTLREVHARLAPGAPLVTLHHSPEAEPAAWFTRSARFGGATPEAAAQAGAEMARRLPAVSPAQDEALLREAGFAQPTLFYAALSFRGWVAVA